MIKSLSFAISCVLAVPLAGFAKEPFDPVEARVLPGWVKADGTRMAALDIQLAPGWKTYWRAPGDAGIPPSFDWSGSQNLASVKIAWPAPKVLDQNGMRSFGYEDRLILPLALAPRSAGEPMELVVDIDMGVCSDICVPYHLSLSGVIDTDATRPTPAIASALAQQPFTAREAGVTRATCRITPISDGLSIEARITMPSAGGAEVMVIEPGLPDVWVSEAQTHREGGDVIATSDMLHVSGGGFSVDRSDIRLTVLGQTHAVDIRGCTGG